jgi:hypothetical protein
MESLYPEVRGPSQYNRERRSQWRSNGHEGSHSTEGYLDPERVQRYVQAASRRGEGWPASATALSPTTYPKQTAGADPDGGYVDARS